ncbi:uncharacterized protein Bfra_010574 [Botrytis fragariae]|uniref:Uncharacterized protein n=1 Tax=Botrytis fragariae TaxID=1964551 RepID=A0A8H6ECP8_9HELO|nr:uncharacterized protein Bfra_010574 [Botrytis fragariae]KAF5867599.1 hypothetical protein Bfra_010574 [Botrytis fragariae]
MDLNIDALSRFIKKMKDKNKSAPGSVPAPPTHKSIWWNHKTLDYLKEIVENKSDSIFYGNWENMSDFRFQGLRLSCLALSHRYDALLYGKYNLAVEVEVDPANLNPATRKKFFVWPDGRKKNSYYSHRTRPNSGKCAGLNSRISQLRTKGVAQSAEIDLRAGPLGQYKINLEDENFGKYLCDTSRNHVPGSANDQAQLHEFGLQLWKKNRPDDGEFPLKHNKKSTTKNRKDTTKIPSSKKSSDDKTQSSRNKAQASSSRTKPSSSRETPQRTDSRDNRDLYGVIPPLATKSSRPKQPSTRLPQERGYPSGWSIMNNPAPEQRRRSPSESREHRLRRSESLAFRPSPSSSVDHYHEPPRSRREPDQRDRQDTPRKSATSNSATKRPARSPGRKDGSKRTRDGIDPIR